MTRSRKYAVLAVAVVLALTGLIVARRGGNEGLTATPPAPTTRDTAPARPYALAPTRSCLRAAGAAVSPVRSKDPRLRALGDLAQRTSLEVHLDDRTLGLAFGDARLLASLLLAPDDPYRLEVRRNAVLVYKPVARKEAAVVRTCLRS